jgi:hypothetical protein
MICCLALLLLEEEVVVVVGVHPLSVQTMERITIVIHTRQMLFLMMTISSMPFYPSEGVLPNHREVGHRRRGVGRNSNSNSNPHKCPRPQISMLLYHLRLVVGILAIIREEVVVYYKWMIVT